MNTNVNWACSIWSTKPAVHKFMMLQGMPLLKPWEWGPLEGSFQALLESSVWESAAALAKRTGQYMVSLVWPQHGAHTAARLPGMHTETPHLQVRLAHLWHEK